MEVEKEIVERLRHPAAVVALLYILSNLVFWGWLADIEAMPILGEIFACACTGGVNAVVIVLLSGCREFRSVAGGALLLLSALLLLAFVPLWYELERVLPTDAQAALAFPFWGGAACVVHAALSLLMLLPILLRHFRKAG